MPADHHLTDAARSSQKHWMRCKPLGDTASLDAATFKGLVHDLPQCEIGDERLSNRSVEIRVVLPRLRIPNRLGL